jgi:hypothetical protein
MLRGKEEIIKVSRSFCIKERSKWNKRKSIYMPASKEIILQFVRHALPIRPFFTRLIEYFE